MGCFKASKGQQNRYRYKHKHFLSHTSKRRFPAQTACPQHPSACRRETRKTNARSNKVGSTARKPFAPNPSHKVCSTARRPSVRTTAANPLPQAETITSAALPDSPLPQAQAIKSAALPENTLLQAQTMHVNKRSRLCLLISCYRGQGKTYLQALWLCCRGRHLLTTSWHGADASPALSISSE